jgi:hypothetical protein
VERALEYLSVLVGRIEIDVEGRPAVVARQRIVLVGFRTSIGDGPTGPATSSD